MQSAKWLVLSAKFYVLNAICYPYTFKMLSRLLYAGHYKFTLNYIIKTLDILLCSPLSASCEIICLCIAVETKLLKQAPLLYVWAVQIFQM